MLILGLGMLLCWHRITVSTGPSHGSDLGSTPSASIYFFAFFGRGEGEETVEILTHEWSGVHEVTGDMREMTHC